MKSDFSDTFLEAAIHATCITDYGSDSSLCCLKIDMTSAFNDCFHVLLLSSLHKEFPALLGCSSWCYQCESMLSFGSSWIKSCAGVQEGIYGIFFSP